MYSFVAWREIYYNVHQNLLKISLGFIKKKKKKISFGKNFFLSYWIIALKMKLKLTNPYQFPIGFIKF